MRKSRRLPVTFTNLILVFGLLASWILFAPAQLGGQVAYVIVNGISMKPGFLGNDLVIMRKAPIYQVGDVVTYRDSTMKAYVIHRIIGIEQDQYVLKGDNNSWIDAYRPVQDEIIGKLWIHLPKFGRVFQWLRLPLNMALTTGLLGGILMTNMLIQQSPQRSKSKRKTSSKPGETFELALYTLGFVTLVFLGLGIFAFLRPLTRPANGIKYQQSGVFFYSASAVPGIYDTDMVRTGEPIFPKLTCSLNVGFVYNVTGNQLQGISGTQTLNARVADELSGWQRTIPLSAEAPFSGDSYSSAAAIDLCQVQSMIASVEQETGFRPNMYTLTITPHVSINGKAGGQEFLDSFEANLVFKFDKVHFYLVTNSAESGDPLRFSKTSQVSSSATQADTLSLFGAKLTTLNLRIISLIGFGFALLGLLILGWYAINIAQHNQEAFIRMKYGSLLMDVYDRGFEKLSPVIDVVTIDDLAKLAERQNAMILHMTRDRMHYYIVQSDGATYRYVISEDRNSAKTANPDLN